MDTTQLITIAVTALVTAFARQIADGIVAFIKNVIHKLARHPVASKPRDWQVIEVGMALWMTGAMSIALAYFASDPEPIQRIDILRAIFWFYMLIYWAKKLLIESGNWIISRKKPENSFKFEVPH